MLSAARAQRSCPQCRLRLLNLFEYGFANLRPDAPRTLSRSISNVRALPSARKSNARFLSTTRRNLQDVQPTEINSGPSDIEITVRQAKRTFGDTLPKDYLNEEEYKLYERLYGAPLRETRPEDVAIPTPEIQAGILPRDPSQKVLLRESEDGTIEEFVYESNVLTSDLEEPENATDLASIEAAELERLPSEAGLTHINAVAKNEREYNTLLRLQKDFENSLIRAAQEDEAEEEEPMEEEEVEEEDEEYEDEPDARFQYSTSRIHKYTRMGEWGTYPSTLQLPKKDFVDPIGQLLTRTDIKHIKNTAEEVFGGAGLPHSVATPLSKRNVPQNPVALAAGHPKMSNIEADAYIATNLPGMYASVMGILVEVRKRLGSEWISKLISRNNGEGPRMLDVGAGGAGLAAWEQVLQAEWELMAEGGKRPDHGPPGKKTVVVGSETLRQRISRFLHNTTFLPRLPDYLHSGEQSNQLDASGNPMPRKKFDIIIASHLLMPLKKDFQRKAMLDNLWEFLSPEGGVLILMEKGHPRGFEAVADVRSRMLKEFIIAPGSRPVEPIELEPQRVREEGRIIAPCTNHKACPMYLTPGLSSGRKDFCHFNQRYIRPPFLQKVLGSAHRNHEDINFSFVAIQRGTLPDMEAVTTSGHPEDVSDRAFKGYEKAKEQPDPMTLPRNILPPLKRRGHVTLDLCTPNGKIERWVVPRSFSRAAYHDARKAQWGDLWALGAKTRTPRNVRLGRGGPAPNDGGVRARRAAQGANKPRTINLSADSGGIYSARGNTRGHIPVERRTKGGKKAKLENLLQELRDEGFT
ncbi:Rsm22-domain-containing protein [Rostrohypoxylon terebratum]|nr:Rsm22-domain-containing protein [Rostrohypoxylon terebratum]